MILNSEQKKGLANLLESLKIGNVTKFPISNVETVPLKYRDNEVVFRVKKRFLTLTIQEAINLSNFDKSVITLESNGMHYYYTKDKDREKIWMPPIDEKAKENEGTILVIQDFPEDGKCITKFIKAQEVEDSSIDEFKDKNIVILQRANLFLTKKDIAILAKVANSLWHSNHTRLNAII